MARWHADSATQLLRRTMIIARRLLKLAGEGAEDKLIEIRIFSPEPRGKSWWCDYEIDWPAAEWKSAGAGADAIQALRLALEKIGTVIYTSAYHRSGRLTWD